MPVLLHVINDLATGGAQRILCGQAAGLDRARWRVHVASLEIVAGGALIEACRAAGVPVHPLRRAHEPRSFAVARLVALLRTLSPDLVHTHLAAADVAGRTAARLAQVPHVVTTFHNLSDWQEGRGRPLRRLERATLPLADRIVTVSDAVRDALLCVEPGLAARTVTVRNGVRVQALRPQPGDRTGARAEFGFAGGDFVVGVVARLEPRKGLDTLLDATARIAPERPHVRLLLVGDGPERRRLVALAERLGIRGRVRFAGDRRDVRRLLAAMDLFAAPSRTEALGIAILEALAAGVPAFGSRVGGIPEVIEDGVCGRLLPPGDAPAWARALSALSTDRSELTRLADGAARRARLFSLEASVAALERVYDELLGQPPRALAEAA